MTFVPTHLLIDGSSFLYRAYYSSSKRNFTNEKGEPVGAVMIFAKMLQSLRAKYPNQPAVMVFDSYVHCFRYELYPDYKINRKTMPEDLRQQCDRIKKLSQTMGFDVISVPGVEADDVIGTYSAQGSSQGAKILICSGDKDLFQLVNSNVVIENTMADEIIDEETGTKKYGVSPERMVDLLALMGDSSDNIPGMPSAGKVTSIAVINGVGGISDIENNPDKVASLKFRGASSFYEKFMENIETIKLSYRLASIKQDVDVPIPFAELAYHKPDVSALGDLYLECGLKDLYSHLPPVSNQEEQTEVSYQIISSLSELKTAADMVRNQGIMVIYAITEGKNYMEDSVQGLVVGIRTGESWYIPVRRDLCDDCLDIQEISGELNFLLQDENITKVVFNYKYQRHAFLRSGFEFRGMVWDPAIEFWLLNSSRGRYDLGTLAFNELQVKMIEPEEILGKGKGKKSWRDLDVDTVASYACQSAYLVMALHTRAFDSMNREGLTDLYRNQYFSMLSVLFDMEETGVLISRQKLKDVETVFSERLNSIEERIYFLAGHQFNPASPKQVADVIFVEQQMLPVDLILRRKVLAGKFTTNEEMLQDLSENYELPALILEFRGLSKLINTYTGVLPEMTYRDTSRLHTTFHQTGTSTGRLSSSEPNLQNIPIRTDEGKLIRQAFIARPGYKILAADYSQIELRILAHLCEDEKMIAAFNQGADIHRMTAAEVLGIPFEEVSDDQRRSAKAINFGIVYGMSAFGLAKQLKIDRSLAQQYIDGYFSKYPKLKRYLTTVVENARKDGFVTTVTGRKIRINDLNSRQVMVVKAAERVATNAPMQGSAADIIQIAMIRIADFVKQQAEKESIYLVLQIHDELVFEVREDLAEQYAAVVSKIMSEAFALKVPLDVGIGIADDWQTAH